MSDLSGHEQPFTLESASTQPLTGKLAHYELSPTELRADEVSFTQLRGPREIARILHLRGQIALPASTADDPGFAAREKKETTWALSARSCGTASASARSATFR